MSGRRSRSSAVPPSSSSSSPPASAASASSRSRSRTGVPRSAGTRSRIPPSARPSDPTAAASASASSAAASSASSSAPRVSSRQSRPPFVPSSSSVPALPPGFPPFPFFDPSMTQSQFMQHLAGHLHDLMPPFADQPGQPRVEYIDFEGDPGDGMIEDVDDYEVDDLGNEGAGYSDYDPEADYDNEEHDFEFDDSAADHELFSAAVSAPAPFNAFHGMPIPHSAMFSMFPPFFSSSFSSMVSQSSLSRNPHVMECEARAAEQTKLRQRIEKRKRNKPSKSEEMVLLARTAPVESSVSQSADWAEWLGSPLDSGSFASQCPGLSSFLSSDHSDMLSASLPYSQFFRVFSSPFTLGASFLASPAAIDFSTTPFGLDIALLKGFFSSLSDRQCHTLALALKSDLKALFDRLHQFNRRYSHLVHLTQEDTKLLEAFAAPHRVGGTKFTTSPPEPLPLPNNPPASNSWFSALQMLNSIPSSGKQRNAASQPPKPGSDKKRKRGSSRSGEGSSAASSSSAAVERSDSVIDLTADDDEVIQIDKRPRGADSSSIASKPSNDECSTIGMVIHSVFALLQLPCLADEAIESLADDFFAAIGKLPPAVKRRLAILLACLYSPDEFVDLVSLVRDRLDSRLEILDFVDYSVMNVVRSLAILYDAAKYSAEVLDKPLIDLSQFEVHWVTGRPELKLDWHFYLTHQSDAANENDDELFTLTRFSFLFTPLVKSKFIAFDHQKEQDFRIQNSRPPMPFFMIDESLQHLCIRVRRNSILEDTVFALSRASMDQLRKPLRVTFASEEAVDAGGPRKEFFSLLFGRMFDPSYGMFIEDEDSKAFFFNPSAINSVSTWSNTESDAEMQQNYELVGRLIGLAIYNNIHIDLKLPQSLFKQLLGQGLSFRDLQSAFPRIYQSLESLLTYEGEDFEDLFPLTFSHELSFYGQSVIAEFQPNGAKTAVTKANRRDYVERFARFLLEQSVSKQFHHFARGFFQVCNRKPLEILSAADLELLLCGTPELDVKAIRSAALYDQSWRTDRRPMPMPPSPEQPNTPQLNWFWEILQEFSPDQLRKFLFFVTGSDRMPIGGAAELRLVIQNAGDPYLLENTGRPAPLNIQFPPQAGRYTRSRGPAQRQAMVDALQRARDEQQAAMRARVEAARSCARLPSAHTCFGTFCLPLYETKDQMREKLLLALENAEGFGMR